MLLVINKLVLQVSYISQLKFKSYYDITYYCVFTSIWDNVTSFIYQLMITSVF